MSKRKFNPFWYFVGILVAANLAVWAGLQKSKAGGFAGIYFFDVGQGDGIYLRTVQGNDILIDGGPGDGILAKLGKAMPFFDRNIELMMLTHPHADHVAGLVEVLKRYKVKQVLLPEASYKSATYNYFLELLKEKNIHASVPKLGQRIMLDDYTVFDVYYPVTGKFTQLPKDINDVSIVGKLSLGKSRVLLTGDAGQEIERLLLSLQLPLSSDILKVGHHGSRHSTSEDFAADVGPAESVISVGRNNRYGHPHEEVLGILKKSGTRISRTDEQGDAVFRIYPDRIDKIEKK